MKSITLNELKLFVDYAQSELVGGILNKVFVVENKIGFIIWKDSHFEVIFDFSSSFLGVVCTNYSVMPKKSANKPLSLFIHAHGKGKVLQSCRLKAGVGRVLEFVFVSDAEPQLEMEVRLFPGGQNLIACFNGKSVSWKKVLDLPFCEVQDFIEDARTPQFIAQQWLELRQKLVVQKKEASIKNDGDCFIKKRKEKIEVAIEKLKKEIELKKNQDWSRVGQWMVAQQSLNVPKELECFIDQSKSVVENIQICFDKHKKNKAKLIKAEQRLKELEEALKTKTRPLSGQIQGEDKSSGIRYRQLFLENGAVALLGKTATDNLSLLRKAKPSDLWLHFKDYPGPHVVIKKNKKDKITDNELFKVAKWLLEQKIKLKQSGLRFDFLVVECRFVRPIKGTRSKGQVLYQNERVLTLNVKNFK